MAWQLLVIRQDSPLRHQLAATGIASSAEKCNIGNCGVLSGCRLDRWWWDSDGSVNADMGQLRGLMGGFMAAFREDPEFFLKLSHKYRRVALHWLEQMGEIASCDLNTADNSTLLRMFDDFCEGAMESNIMLMPPFAVERLQAGPQYKGLLEHLAAKLETRLLEEVRVGNGYFPAFYLAHMVPRPSKQELINTIANIVEFSTEPTFGEQKELMLLKLAAQIVEREPQLTESLSHDQLPSRDEIQRQAYWVVSGIDALVDQFGWIKQWGYPPFYGPSTFDDIVAEIAQRVRANPGEKYQDAELKHDLERARYESFARHVPIDQPSLTLIETINEYNFLRTWRMEVVMRCQFLSMPLLREIEQRAIAEGKMETDDIFLLMAPEIRSYLLEGAVPDTLSERRHGWVMTSHDDKVEIWVGDQAEKRRQAFYSVMDHRERARGRYGHESETVGGKAENLFALADIGQSVPRFFVVTTQAYRAFLRESCLDEKLAEILRRHRVQARAQDGDQRSSGTSWETSLTHVEREVHDLFLGSSIPGPVADAIRLQAAELDLSRMAVRSSATCEDARRLSWAGRFHSYVYVGAENLLTKVKEVWASLYNSVALTYALEHGLDPQKLEMAVLIQEMVEPRCSGVINTSWSTGMPDVMEIEAVWGQCTPLVSGEVTPDTYLVRKGEPAEIMEKRVVTQERRLTSSGLGAVPADLKDSQKLPDQLIRDLSGLALAVERYFERPQDIEWVQTDAGFFLVQTRPMTGPNGSGEGSANGEEQASVADVRGDLILTGQKGKVATRVVGRAFVAETFEEGEGLASGDIIVVPAATPRWDPILVRAAAIITNEGGSTSHAIRVANERSLPAVVGTGKATKTIRMGDMLLVDTSEPFRGKVYLLAAQE